jgi:hypothetical protein
MLYLSYYEACFSTDASEDIDAVRRQSGLEASTEFFDAFIEKTIYLLKKQADIKNPN